MVVGACTLSWATGQVFSSRRGPDKLSTFCGILMNYFGNRPQTEATGRLRHMEADVVTVLLKVVFAERRRSSGGAEPA